MTAITWVLAADEHRARVFETRGLKLDLQQVQDIRNSAVHSVNSRDIFAKEIATFLEQSRLNHRFDRLRLAVEAPFLSVLDVYLSSDIRALVHDDPGNDAQRARRHIERY
ncbi:host attachment protein [Caballeronia sp. Lep1P3]|uniref:host attachment protein n=1 Tax=Caballeronia sp. Lep1P3 TaxID=2878150 RepID=UPI001FD449DF|nr:host attachment protein [Caballeronia sp. Lep1P3]